MKRVFSIVLAMLMCLTVSCAQAENEDKIENAEKFDESASGEAAETDPQPDLPPMDFEGDNFVFLTREMTGQWEAANIMDIYAEEENGEGLNDAVFQRNMFMADTYGVVIEEIKTADCNNQIRTTVAAKDGAFDAAYIEVANAVSNTNAGNFLNYRNMNYVDFDQPWWDDNSLDTFEINGKVFMAVNDIMLANNNATGAVIFNKQMLENYGFTENMYDLVTEEKWSLDKLAEMSKQVCNDEDGNGIYDENDVYGLLCYRDASLSFFHSSGGRIAKKNKEGGIDLTLMREKTYDACIAALTLMAEKSTMNLHKVIYTKYPNDCYTITEDMFRNDQGLFYWILIHDVQKFRDMESDFGILPVPSADPETFGYGCGVNKYHGCLMSVLTTADPEQAGYVLEAMSAKSRYTVQDEYYNICLARKYSRDEESSAMLDIIFENRVYDIGTFYDFGGLAGDFILMTMTDDTNMASKFVGKKRMAEKAIKSLIETYEELE